MTDKRMRLPDEGHPITITPTGRRVVVSRGGRTVADTTQALTLQEATYPPVQYVPLADVDGSLLEPTDHATYCPFKGDAGYYSLVVEGDRAENAVWVYRTPYDAVSEIAGHVAFYPQQVEISIG